MKALKIFCIKPEERIQAIVALVVIVALNAFFIYRLHEMFMQPGFGPYWKVFERELHLAGYDPYTYLTVTDWDVVYEVHRHPLLAFLVWPLFLINQGLTWVFGVNCVQYIVALPVIVSSLYSYIFMYRIQREVIQLELWDATLLTVFFFSNAYILLSVIVPDHFTISMFLLLITLYISGVCIQKGREFNWWQSAILFFITAGVTLSNGIKVFLAGFFVNLRDFFRPKYLLMAVILPAALLWGVALWEFQTFSLPKRQHNTEQKIRKAEELKARVALMSPEERAKFEEKKAKREARLRLQAAKTGKPMENKGFLKWTDVTTSRWQSIYENLFGESIQFHQDYFLEDTLVHRPVFVSYNWSLSYWIEALVVLIFLAGIWCGRKSRFLWLCLSCFAFDMFIHLVLGFGLNEIHIMTPHWLFVMPIAIAFLLREVKRRWVRIPIVLLTLYLLSYNGYLLTSFLLSKLWIVL
jgi:hypothetical protein